MNRFENPGPSPDSFDDEADPYPVQFSQLEAAEADQTPKDVEQYDNVNLTVSIELGRIESTVAEILSLKEGELIETEKLSGNPMEIFVNGQLFGRGEVVVVGDNLAIRITELIKQEEKRER